MIWQFDMSICWCPALWCAHVIALLLESRESAILNLHKGFKHRNQEKQWPRELTEISSQTEEWFKSLSRKCLFRLIFNLVLSCLECLFRLIFNLFLSCRGWYLAGEHYAKEGSVCGEEGCSRLLNSASESASTVELGSSFHCVAVRSE